jgi:hypothetical protein
MTDDRPGRKSATPFFSHLFFTGESAMSAVLVLLLTAPPERPDLTVAVPAESIDARTWEAYDGKRIAVRAQLAWASLTGEYLVHGVGGCDDVALWLPKAGPDRTGSTVIAEATVRLVRHPRRGGRAAYVEVRLLDAALAR